MLMRLIEPTEGSILFEKEEVTKLSPQQLRKVRRDMQMIFKTRLHRLIRAIQ